MDIELFIDVVKEYEFLYDTGNSSYKDTDKKNSTWDDIAKTVNLSNGAVAKGKWRNLRDSYLKYLKTIKTVKGQAKKKYKKWPHAEQMEFLKPYVTAKGTHSNIPKQEIEHGEEEHGSDDDQEEEGNTQTSKQVAENAIPSGTLARPKRPASDKSTTSKEEVLKYLNEKKARQSKEEDVDLFFAGLAAIVKKLPKTKQARLKLECSKLILQAEIEHEDSKTDP